MKLLIGGGPRTGKTTLAKAIAAAEGIALTHTDDLMATHAWSEASEEIARRIVSQPGDWIIEGVAVARALRKAIALAEMPSDLQVRWLREPVVARTPGQEAMAKGCETVWREILPLLQERGVDVCDCKPEERTGGGHHHTCPAFEQECACYELTGGHQPGCAFARTP